MKISFALPDISQAVNQMMKGIKIGLKWRK